jgi:hypothetical protein
MVLNRLYLYIGELLCVALTSRRDQSKNPNVQCAPRDANGLRIAPFFEHPAAAGYATVNTLGALDAPAA